MNNVLRRTPQFRLIITVEGQSPPKYQVFRFSPGGHYRVGLPDGHYQVDMAKNRTDRGPDVPKTIWQLTGGDGYSQSHI